MFSVLTACRKRTQKKRSHAEAEASSSTPATPLQRRHSSRRGKSSKGSLTAPASLETGRGSGSRKKRRSRVEAAEAAAAEPVDPFAELAGFDHNPFGPADMSDRYCALRAPCVD